MTPERASSAAPSRGASMPSAVGTTRPSPRARRARDAPRPASMRRGTVGRGGRTSRPARQLGVEQVHQVGDADGRQPATDGLEWRQHLAIAALGEGDDVVDRRATPGPDGRAGVAQQGGFAGFGLPAAGRPAAGSGPQRGLTSVCPASPAYPAAPRPGSPPMITPIPIPTSPDTNRRLATPGDTPRRARRGRRGRLRWRPTPACRGRTARRASRRAGRRASRGWGEVHEPVGASRQPDDGDADAGEVVVEGHRAEQRSGELDGVLHRLAGREAAALAVDAHAVEHVATEADRGDGDGVDSHLDGEHDRPLGDRGDDGRGTTRAGGLRRRALDDEPPCRQLTDEVGDRRAGQPGDRRAAVTARSARRAWTWLSRALRLRRRTCSAPAPCDALLCGCPIPLLHRICCRREDIAGARSRRGRSRGPVSMSAACPTRGAGTMWWCPGGTGYLVEKA